MPRIKALSARGGRIADRLAVARESGFIGRGAEIALFRAALSTNPPAFAVLLVHGPGGIGKTTLLRELAALARAEGRTVVRLDGRDVEPSRSGFLRALGEAVAEAGSAPCAAGVPEGSVVLFDTYEELFSLDGWLRETVLPQWPVGTLVVLAGRRPPSISWTTDVAWARLMRVVALGNFSPEETHGYLVARGVPPAAQARVLEFTHGHPLALALVAELLTAKGAVDFDPLEAPDVVGHLSAVLLARVPEERCRQALEACAVWRVTQESLLVDLQGEAAGKAAFEWLREQTFVQSGPHGLFPHDLVRAVILAEARWRDASAFETLRRRAYGALHARIPAARGRDRQRLQMDALYVTRASPTHAAFFAWDALDEGRLDPAEDADVEWIVEVVARHEGPESASLASRWWRAQPAAFQVFRGADDVRFGFLALLDVGDDRSGGPPDPAIASARAFVARHGPVGRGEGVVHLRWWMHAKAYQAVTAAINLTAMHVVSHCLTRPGMAWNFVTMADPTFWTPHFQGVNFPRASEADFEVGGRHYGVFAHDWRTEPPAAWILGTRTPMRFAVGTGLPTAPGWTEDAFRRAVRESLRDFTRPDALAGGPLRSARLVRDARTPEARGVMLQALLREGVETLRSNPRDDKLRRALWHTYIEPLATQEQVAERLDLPFSTYRHHLSRGIECLARWLWQREQSVPRP